MEGQRRTSHPKTHTPGLAMTVAHPTITADHEQHDHAAIPGAHVRSPYDRMLAGFSHHVLHRPLRAYQRFAGAALLASILTACGAAFTALVARQTCPEPTERLGKNERSAHLEAGLLCRSIRSGDTLVKSAPRFRPQVTTSLPRLQSLLTAAQQFAPLTRRYPDGRDVVLKPKT